jgi:enoyl-CoA hydratase
LPFDGQGPRLPASAQEFLIDANRTGTDWSDCRQPLGFLDLAACPDHLRIDALPPFPLIGLGNPAHPLAGALDAMIEPPISVDMLVRQVRRTPKAAAVAMQLLRSVEGLPSGRALPLESLCYGLLQGSAEHAAWLASRAPAAPPIRAGNLFAERRGPILFLTLDRPWARNAIDRALRDQLVEAFTLAALDGDVSAIKLRAVGAAFSVGGDLQEFGTSRDPASAHLIRSRSLPALALGDRSEILDVHVQGACVGAGLEIAAFAGRLTAAVDAWFQLPELAMGLIPGAGGCVSVPRRIGRQRTGLMILSGRRINAATALRWGLIDAIDERPQADHR